MALWPTILLISMGVWFALLGDNWHPYLYGPQHVCRALGPMLFLPDWELLDEIWCWSVSCMVEDRRFITGSGCYTDDDPGARLRVAFCAHLMHMPD